jgi:hypothetical protein
LLQVKKRGRRWLSSFFVPQRVDVSANGWRGAAERGIKREPKREQKSNCESKALQNGSHWNQLIFFFDLGVAT